MKRKKLLISIIILIILIFSVSFFGIIKKEKDNIQNIYFENMYQSIINRNGYYINSAVLYLYNYDNAERTIDYLNQSISINNNVEAVDISKELPQLEKYDILYLDESIKELKNYNTFSDNIISYVKNGGNIFIPNNLHHIFPKEFLGIKSFIKLNEAPIKITTPQINKEIKPLQKLIIDFSKLYKDYEDNELLLSQDYGVAVIPKEAITVAKYKKYSIYTLNSYGKGLVFYTNPLLPNKFSKSSFNYKETSSKQAPYSNTTDSFNQLLYSYFTSFISKRIYGFSVNRIFGSYTAPSMCWSLHYENILGIKENSLKSFSNLLERYNQIPSFSLVRNALHWFTRTETAVYMLNTSKNNKDLIYKTNLYENPYSSGTHIACNNEWLQLHTRYKAQQGFGGNTKNKVLFYPFIIDYNKDGHMDIFSGSSDGKIRYFKSLGFSGQDGRLVLENPQILNAYVDGFSAPQLIDIDGDGILDIISGAKDGNIYYFKGYKDLNFKEKELFIKTDIQGISLPSVGDINNDGIPDIVVGSDTGVLLFYYGKKNGKSLEYSTKYMGAISKQCADLELGKYLSPFIIDYNKDGISDIIIGTKNGYIARLKGDKNKQFIFDGAITTDEMNIKGNYNLKFGMFPNPRLIDLNKDGKLDLLVGYEDTDLPYPIDSPYFPYKKQLMEQIQYAKSKHYYIGMHYYAGEYASIKRQLYEIKEHLKTLNLFGISNNIGINQHYGAITQLSENDSYNLLYNSGLLWESYYVPKEHHFIDTNVENTVVNPFFMVQNGERKILMQNLSSALFCECLKSRCKRTNMADIGLKYESPVLNYYHTEYMSPDTDNKFVSITDKYRKKYGYNFVKENQMMYASAAAYNLKVNVTAEDGKIKISQDIENNKFPLFNKDFQSAAGIKIELTSRLKENIDTESVIWQRKNNNLYIGLDRDIYLLRSKKQKEKPHLTQINIPAKIETIDNSSIIHFLDDGLMQVSVQGRAYSKDNSWQTEYKNNITTFTKFGDKDILTITFGEQNK